MFALLRLLIGLRRLAIVFRCFLIWPFAASGVSLLLLAAIFLLVPELSRQSGFAAGGIVAGALVITALLIGVGRAR